MISEKLPGLKKKPSTSEALDWIKLLLVEDLDPSDLKYNAKDLLPKLHGALIKNEQDIHLFEQLHLFLEIKNKCLLIFFLNLKDSKIPVSMNEFLTFLKSFKFKFVQYDIDKFYYLARTCLVKDEKLIDKFDIIFGHILIRLRKLKLMMS